MFQSLKPPSPRQPLENALYYWVAFGEFGKFLFPLHPLFRWRFAYLKYSFSASQSERVVSWFRGLHLTNFGHCHTPFCSVENPQFVYFHAIPSLVVAKSYVAVNRYGQGQGFVSIQEKSHRNRYFQNPAN